MKLPGAEGYASELRQPSHLKALYFFLTANGSLVKVVLNAYPAGDGLRWVAPIVNSFTYDISAPKIVGLKVEPGIWKAGETRKVYFKAFDEYAGVSLRSAFVNLTLAGSKNDWINSDLQGTPEGEGWYSKSITVGPYQAPGNYCVDRLQVSDRASNYAFLERTGKDPGFYEYVGDLAKTYPTQIPVACITVENAGPVDSAPPMLAEIRADEAVWDTGREHRLSFRLTDEVSGVKLDSISCGNQTSEFTCSGARDDGGGWYSVTVKLNPFMANQELEVAGLSVGDNAGNEVNFVSDRATGRYSYFRSLSPFRRDDQTSNVPIFKQRIRNPNRVDATPPEFLALEAPTPFRAGATGRIRFRARDEGAGLLLKTSEPEGAEGKAMELMLVPMREEGRSIWTFTYEIVAEGNDWYHADFPVSPFEAAGEYFIWTAEIKDRAYNSAELDCGEHDATRRPVPSEFCRAPGGAKLPGVRLTIIK